MVIEMARRRQMVSFSRKSTWPPGSHTLERVLKIIIYAKELPSSARIAENKRKGANISKTRKKTSKCPTVSSHAAVARLMLTKAPKRSALSNRRNSNSP